MTDQEKILLDEFEGKLRHLLFLYNKSISRNRELEEQLLNSKRELEDLRERFSQLESEYKHLKNAATLSLNGADINETKKELADLVREIDNCITILNYK